MPSFPKMCFFLRYGKLEKWLLPRNAPKFIKLVFDQYLLFFLKEIPPSATTSITQALRRGNFYWTLSPLTWEVKGRIIILFYYITRNSMARAPLCSLHKLNEANFSWHGRGNPISLLYQFCPNLSDVTEIWLINPDTCYFLMICKGSFLLDRFKHKCS